MWHFDTVMPSVCCHIILIHWRFCILNCIWFLSMYSISLTVARCLRFCVIYKMSVMSSMGPVVCPLFSRCWANAEEFLLFLTASRCSLYLIFSCLHVSQYISVCSWDIWVARHHCFEFCCLYLDFCWCFGSVGSTCIALLK